ncbi:MAG: 30S ribosomal protein S6 [Chitinispirillaceae bacterium]
MIRPYETAIVIDGSLPEDVIQKEQKKLEEFFSANAELEKVDVWGKRALAYPIKKKRSGHYVLFLYKGEGNVPAEFEKSIKLNENILRHLTVVRNVKNDIARAELVARRERSEAAAAAGEDKESADQE